MTLMTVNCELFLDGYAERRFFGEACFVGEVSLLPRGSAHRSPLRASWRPYRMALRRSAWFRLGWRGWTAGGAGAVSGEQELPGCHRTGSAGVSMPGPTEE